MKLGILDSLRSEKGITHGPFAGYFWWTLVVMTLLTVFSVLSGSASFVNIIQLIMIYGAMAISYDYFAGFTGYFNLGFACFTAIGTYAFTFAANGGVNVFVALFLAGVAGAIFAAAISYPFLRLRGAYFGIGTLALVLLLYYIDINFPNVTGGLIGLHVTMAAGNITDPLILGSLLFLLLTMWVHFRLAKSKMGLALRSIKEEEDVSESYGVNAFRMKQFALVLSGFFAGIAGGLFALYLVFINAAAALGLSGAFFPVVAAMTGGTGIFLGPLVGSFILTYVNLNLPSFVTSVDPTLVVGPLAITGILLLIVGLFIPAGLLRLKFLQNYAYRNPDSVLVNLFRRKHVSPVQTAQSAVSRTEK